LEETLPQHRNFENVEVTLHSTIAGRQGLLIDGRWIEARQGEHAVILLIVKDKGDGAS